MDPWGEGLPDALPPRFSKSPARAEVAVAVVTACNATPVVATELPGVREPVRMTGMGEVVPVRDPSALADALTRVLQERSSYVRRREEIEELFDLERTLDRYEALFAEVRRLRHRGR